MLELFPWSLLLTLLAITWLVKLAELNGCVERVAGFLQLRLARWPLLIPWAGFVAAAVLSAAGLGNIAAIALLAPPMLALARGLRLSPFLMTLLLVGGANATALSPFSLTGIVVRHAVARYPEPAASSAVSVMTLVLSFLMMAVAHAAGFWWLGGRAWTKGLRDAKPRVTTRAEILERQSWSKKQIRMGWVLILFLFLTLLLKSAGWGAALSLALAASLRLGEFEQALRRVPWALLALISAVSVVVGLVERELGFGLLTQLAEMAESPFTVLAVLSAATSLLSIFSSSSGVVLPLMLPLLMSLSRAHPVLSIEVLVVSVVVSSHLVDCSPFSSLGALSIASVPDGKEATQLFRQLLVWGFAMLPVGLLLCWGVLQLTIALK
jgi:Na+/H+ antiporter NhaD/arsenite permease-like protein